MNYTDFTQLGGFPLDQKVLKHNQDAMIQHLGAYYAGGGTTPLIISGMTPVVIGGGGMGLGGIGDGFCVIAGELLEFKAAVLPPMMPGVTLYIKIFETKQPALFHDGSTKNVWDITRYATLSTTDGVPFDDFKLWHEVILGTRSKTQWTLLWSDTTSTTVRGTIYYRKDLIANTIQLRGSIQVFAALFSSGEDTAPVYRSVAITLPVGFRPAYTAPFTLYRRYHGVAYVRDVNSKDYIHQVNAELRDSGQILVGFIKPEVGVADYTLYFNQNIPLG